MIINVLYIIGCIIGILVLSKFVGYFFTTGALQALDDKIETVKKTFKIKESQNG